MEHTKLESAGSASPALIRHTDEKRDEDRTMNHFKQLFLMMTASLLLSGCNALSLGESDFTCSGGKNKHLCAGPRDVYEMTNTHDNLDHLMKTPDEIRAEHEEGAGGTVEETAPSPGNHTSPAVMTSQQAGGAVYEPRDLRRQYPGEHQPSRLVGQVSSPSLAVGSSGEHSAELRQLQQFARPPEDIAPEPLAVLLPAQAMRILVNAYTDRGGDLHMPGYIYVELKPRTWAVGTHAPLRPARIVPFQVQNQSNEQQRASEVKAQGVNGLGIIQPNKR